MKKAIYFTYGVVCHAMFLGVFLYFVGFLANAFVPVSIDSPSIDSAEGASAAALGLAIATNVLLILAFGLQHSVMARPTFKRWWTKLVPPVVERSTYVLVSNLILMLVVWQWQPLPHTLWDVQAPLARGALWALMGGGVLLIVFASLLINHFDLFGTRQVWLYLRGKAYTPPKFGTPLLYKGVRHPLYVGWFLVFWCTPTMTVGHALFALGMSSYILIAIWFEERNLVEEHAEYAAYRQRVPMLVPFLKR